MKTEKWKYEIVWRDMSEVSGFRERVNRAAEIKEMKRNRRNLS